MYRRLKLEFFYLRKMLRRRAGLKEFYGYYKNKFFGRYLFKRMPKFSSGPVDPEFELHILSQKSMLWPMAVGIRSFLHHSGLSPRILIHVEEEFDSATIRLLEEKFNNVTVIPWKEATARIEALPDVPEKIKKYRFGKNPIILKLIDGMLLAKAKHVMVLGTDVFFYSQPSEIVDFVRDGSAYEAWGSYDTNPPPMAIKESYAKKYDVYARRAEHLNSDLMIFRRDLIGLDQFIEYFENTLEPEGYFVDMTGFAVLLTNLKFNFFPYERYKIKGGVDETTVTKHFTGPRRDELYSYGIDLALRRMKLNL